MYLYVYTLLCAAMYELLMHFVRFDNTTIDIETVSMFFEMFDGIHHLQ